MSPTPTRLLSTPPELRALIEANARLWTAEAEVFSTYFASRSRTATTDEAWLARQCFKELFDGACGRLNQLLGTDFAVEQSRDAAAQALNDEIVRVELAHYAAFRVAHRASCEAAGLGAVAQARIGLDWPENAELQALRADHRREFGALGARAAAFTEGGYCTLYRAGMSLAGGSALDDAIAAACALVYDDEWDHMLAGIAGLAETPLDPPGWQLLHALTLAQGRLRIRMRNAQFGRPLSSSRVIVLEGGAAEPLPFDYVRAGLAPP